MLLYNTLQIDFIFYRHGLGGLSIRGVAEAAHGDTQLYDAALRPLHQGGPFRKEMML